MNEQSEAARMNGTGPSACSARLLNALQRGTVRNAGGVLIDCQCSALGMVFDDLYAAVQYLRASGYRVERIDAGGAPEWVLLPNASVSIPGGEPGCAPRECSEDSAPEFEPCDICGGTDATFDGFCVQCEIPLDVIDPNS